MAENPIERLQEQGRRATPPIDPAFADRLESALRVQHQDQASTHRRWAPLLPRVAVVAVVLVAGLLGVVALTGTDAGLPVSVVDEGPVADAPDGGGTDGGGTDDAAGTPDAESVGVVADPTPSPTATASPASVVATPTTTAEPLGEPAGTDPNVDVSGPTPTVETQPPGPTPTTPVSTAEPEPPPPTPTPTVATTPIASPPPAATATPIPATPIPLPTPTETVRPTPTPTPTPTVPREPVAILLTCEARVVGDAVGVVCNWDHPVLDADLASYEITRATAGVDPVVVSTQRAQAPRTYVDRNIEFGERVGYLVRGRSLDGRVLAVSAREVVEVPPGP